MPLHKAGSPYKRVEVIFELVDQGLESSKILVAVSEAAPLATLIYCLLDGGNH